MRAINIEILFDLNVYTRAHFSLRAQIKALANEDTLLRTYCCS